VSGEVGSGSCNSGEDGDGETWPNSRGLRGGGVWPSSPRMVDGGGSGGVRWGPELLSRRRWMGGIKGGAVEERTWRAGVDERDGTKKRDRQWAAPFMVARWSGRDKGAGGPELKGVGRRVAATRRGEALEGGGGPAGGRSRAWWRCVEQRGAGEWHERGGGYGWCHVKEGGGEAWARSRHADGGQCGGLVVGRAHGRRRRAPVDDVRAGEGMVPHVGHAQRRGAAGERRELGRPLSNSVDF
jgi:hypothetical protein